MIFDTFGCVFFVLLDFVGKTSFSFATEISYRSYRSESALICPEKAKQNLEPLDRLKVTKLGLGKDRQRSYVP
jgi:hypothetical protein